MGFRLEAGTTIPPYASALQEVETFLQEGGFAYAKLEDPLKLVGSHAAKAAHLFIYPDKPTWTAPALNETSERIFNPLNLQIINYSSVGIRLDQNMEKSFLSFPRARFMGSELNDDNHHEFFYLTVCPSERYVHELVERLQSAENQGYSEADLLTGVYGRINGINTDQLSYEEARDMSTFPYWMMLAHQLLTQAGITHL